MENSKIVILGEGLLGTTLKTMYGWDVVSLESHQIDFTKPETYKDHILNYDVVINCIANTDTYSQEREDHWNVNYKGVSDLVDVCNEYKIKLVQISTDYVYGGGALNCTEDEVPVHQQTWYSYTKLLGDSHVQLKSNNYLIVRGGHKPRPFPFDKAYDNIMGNFDYVDVNCEIIEKLITKNASGVFNIGTEPKSIYDLAKQTKEDVLRTTCMSCPIPKTLLMNLSKLKKFLNDEN